MTNSTAPRNPHGTAATQGPERATSGGIPAVQPLALIRTLGVDLGLPLVAYYVLHGFGVSDWTALLVATLVAGTRMAWVAVRERTLNLFATAILLSFGLGVALTLISGDARFLLLKNSALTGAVGLIFLATVVFGRPLTLAAAQSFQPARAAEFGSHYRTNPRYRRKHRVSSAVWGGGLFLEAVVRVPLVYLLPVSVMVGLGEALSIGTFVVLMLWNVWYNRRLGSSIAGKRGEVDRDVSHSG